MNRKNGALRQTNTNALNNVSLRAKRSNPEQDCFVAAAPRNDNGCDGLCKDINDICIRQGFTLIELMLVVIIIGVLAAMVMPRFVGRSEQARIAAAKADVEANISVALDMYEMDIGHYPQSLDDLLTKGSNPDQWRGPYLKKKPIDPWGREYIYKLGSLDKDYSLCSKGPDEAKADDDICNDGAK